MHQVILTYFDNSSGIFIWNNIMIKVFDILLEKINKNKEKSYNNFKLKT